MAAPVIEVHDLVVHYPGQQQRAVDGISFSATRGSIVALLGPNGAGKTTTVETLEGYRRPTHGWVRILGHDPATEMSTLAPLIGVMLQRNGVYLSMGPRQILKLFAAYYGAQARPAEEMLDLVGLRAVATTPWRRLSGGEQQRLSLGLALIGNPKVAFLDEPTAGMDPAARQVLWTVITSLRDKGATVLLTTHYLEEAERLADDVIIIDRGSVVASGTPESLRRSDQPVIRFSAATGLQVDALSEAFNGVTAAEDSPGEYVIDTAPTPQAIATLTAWLASHQVELGDLRGSRQRLEDVFLRLTAETPPAGGFTAGSNTKPTDFSARRRRPRSGR